MGSGCPPSSRHATGRFSTFWTGRWWVRNNIIVAILGLVMVSAWLASASDEAPMDGGTFLVYEIGSSTMRLTFSPGEGEEFFSSSLQYAVEHVRFESDEPPDTPGEIVDARMRTADGRVFELASLGPLWVPPSEVHEGGSAHGTRISEIRRWGRWD